MQTNQIGDYAIQSVLGEGATAVVYRAHHATPPATDEGAEERPQPVALKVLKPDSVRQPQVLACFQFEGRVLARLRHPGILRVFETGDDDDRLYTAMESIDGEVLDQYLLSEERLAEVEAVDLGGQLAAALDYLHGHGYVHRDLKPANIMLSREGRAILFDFGTVITITDGAPYEVGLYGTPSFLAPEQIEEGGRIDGRADIYALGVILYLMVTGRKPFYGAREEVLQAHLHEPPPRPSEFAHVSPELEAIILRALAKRPTDRFQSGAEFEAALDSVTLVPPQRSFWQRLLGR